MLWRSCRGELGARGHAVLLCKLFVAACCWALTAAYAVVFLQGASSGCVCKLCCCACCHVAVCCCALTAAMLWRSCRGELGLRVHAVSLLCGAAMHSATAPATAAAYVPAGVSWGCVAASWRALHESWSSRAGTLTQLLVSRPANRLRSGSSMQRGVASGMGTVSGGLHAAMCGHR
jgi:hypothetical protein